MSLCRLHTVKLLVFCAAVACRTSDGHVKIGAFNVQVFGTSFAADPAQVAALVRVCKAYDVVCIQEIRDSSGTAFRSLMTALGPDYNSTISPRLGRSTSKEQYAVIWRTAADLSVDVARAAVYDDDAHDVFEREPFLVPVTLFPSSTMPLSLLLAVIHVAPGDAVVEIDALVDVYDSVAVPAIGPSALILGDFNAGWCVAPVSLPPPLPLSPSLPLIHRGARRPVRTCQRALGLRFGCAAMRASRGLSTTPLTRTSLPRYARTTASSPRVPHSRRGYGAAARACGDTISPSISAPSSPRKSPIIIPWSW